MDSKELGGTESRTSGTALSPGPTPSNQPAESGSGENLIALLREIIPTVIFARKELELASIRYFVGGQTVELSDSARKLNGWLDRARDAIRATEGRAPKPLQTVAAEDGEPT